MQQKHTLVPKNAADSGTGFVISCSIWQFIVFTKSFAITYCTDTTLYIHLFAHHIFPYAVDSLQECSITGQCGYVGHARIQVHRSNCVTLGFFLRDNRHIILKILAVLVFVFAFFVIILVPALLDEKFGKVEVFFFAGYAV